MMLQHLCSLVRCLWYQKTYCHALKRLVVREQIETFPSGGVARRHPWLRQHSLATLRARADQRRRRLQAAGYPLPPSVTDVYWAIGYLQDVRRDAQDDHYA